MDFRTRDGYVLTHEEDAITGILTVTLKNLAETEVIGQFILEPQKLQVVAESLVELSEQILLRRTDAKYRRRTFYYKNNARAKTEFFV